MQRIHREDRAKWQETIDQAIDEKSDYDVEFRLLFPNGTVKYSTPLATLFWGHTGI